MKKILLVLLTLSVFMSGCVNAKARTPSNVTKMSQKNDIEVTVLETIPVNVSIFGSKKGDVGLRLKIRNNSSEVKYVVWSASSLGFDGIVSRVANGNDKVININSVVPNTALMAGRETTVVIYAADVIQYSEKTPYVSAYYYTETPIKDKVELLLSYSGNDTSKLEQAQYDIELPTSK